MLGVGDDLISALGCSGDSVGGAVGTSATLVGVSRKSDDMVGVDILRGTVVGGGLIDVHPDTSRLTAM